MEDVNHCVSILAIGRMVLIGLYKEKEKEPCMNPSMRQFSCWQKNKKPNKVIQIFIHS